MAPQAYSEAMDSALARIERRLPKEILFGGRGELVEPEEIAAMHNYIWTEELANVGIVERFIGQYRTDRWQLGATRVYASNGKRGCSPLEFIEGVLAYAVQTGKDQHIPDVTNLPSAIARRCGHVSCDPNMTGTELVSIAWIPVPNSPNYFPGILFDEDFAQSHALNPIQRQRIRDQWDIWGTIIARKQQPYSPPEGAFILTPKMAEKRGIKLWTIEQARERAVGLYNQLEQKKSPKKKTTMNRGTALGRSSGPGAFKRTPGQRRPA